MTCSGVEAYEAAGSAICNGWGTLWPGLAKNLVDTPAGPPATLRVALAAVTLAWAAVAIPMFNVVAVGRDLPGASAALVMALLGSGVAFGLHIAATFYFRIPFC